MGNIALVFFYNFLTTKINPGDLNNANNLINIIQFNNHMNTIIILSFLYKCRHFKSIEIYYNLKYNIYN